VFESVRECSRERERERESRIEIRRHTYTHVHVHVHTQQDVHTSTTHTYTHVRTHTHIYARENTHTHIKHSLPAIKHTLSRKLPLRDLNEENTARIRADSEEQSAVCFAFSISCTASAVVSGGTYVGTECDAM
jgi:hypothetical protein